MRSLIVRRYLAPSKQTYQFTADDGGEKWWAKAVVMRINVIAQIKSMNANKHYWYAPQGALPTRETFKTASVAYWKNAKQTITQYDQFRGDPYLAIKSICDVRSNTIGECNGAIKACIWYGAAIATGEDYFNVLHTDFLLMSKTDAGLLSPSLGVHLILPNADTDIKTLIPGDWVYMINHNYGEIIDKENDFQGKNFEGVPLLNSPHQYAWTGENYLLVGESNGQDLYEGLGSGVGSEPAGPVTEKQARAQMLEYYNRSFERLFRAKEKMKNGTPITELLPDDALNKIIFKPSSIFRVQP